MALTAYRMSVCLCLTSATTPKPPTPIFLMTEKSSNDILGFAEVIEAEFTLRVSILRRLTKA